MSPLPFDGHWCCCGSPAPSGPTAGRPMPNLEFLTLGLFLPRCDIVVYLDISSPRHRRIRWRTPARPGGVQHLSKSIAPPPESTNHTSHLAVNFYVASALPRRLYHVYPCAIMRRPSQSPTPNAHGIRRLADRWDAALSPHPAFQPLVKHRHDDELKFWCPIWRLPPESLEA